MYCLKMQNYYSVTFISKKGEGTSVINHTQRKTIFTIKGTINLHLCKNFKSCYQTQSYKDPFWKSRVQKVSNLAKLFSCKEI